MKRLQFFFAIFFVISCTNQSGFFMAEKNLSRIDSLSTNEQVEQLIGSADSLYLKFKLKKVQDIRCNACDSSLIKLANSLEINFSYVNADLDNNGFTDLLATGENKTYTLDNYDQDLDVELSKDFNAFVLMDFGPEKIKLYDLTDGRFFSIAPLVEYTNGSPSLVIYQPAFYSPVNRLVKAQTKSELIFKFNDFVEYNPGPSNHNIEKIEYSAGFLYGLLPCFYFDY